jgi:hypothetical protein
MSVSTAPLGRWHRWWLDQFRDAWNKRSEKHGGGICVVGYEGAVQGQALAGLITRGLISYDMGFDSGLALLTITEKGLRHVA